MFTTCLQNEIPSLVRPDHIRHWWSVGLKFESCWFFCAPSGKQGTRVRPCFVTSPESVIALTAKEGWAKGIDVTVATPPHLNQTPRWRFQKLGSVWLCKEPDLSQWAYILQTEDGDEYAISPLETPARFLVKLEQVCIAGLRPGAARARSRK